MVSLYATNTGNDSLQSYFNRIDEIIKKKDQYPIAFLDTEFLMGAKESATGKEKVDLLLQLYSAYVYISREEAFRYNEEAKQLSKNIGFKKGQLQAAYNTAYLMFVRGEFDEAFYEILEIEKDLKGMPFMEIKADITTLKSDIYTERGEYDKALELGLGLLQVAENTADDYMLMRAYAALSHYYLRIGNYPKARSYCLQGLDYIIKLKKTEYFYHKINEIARMTAKIEGPERALEVYSFFFKLEEKMAPPGDYVQSITYMILSDIYMSIDKLDQAQDYLSKALILNYKNDFRFRIPRALIQQAELHLKQEDTLNAILNYKKSIEAAERINAFDVMKSSSAILSQMYRHSNQFSKSFEYQTLHSAIVDSLFTNEQDQKIKILEAKQSIKEMSQQKQILELKNKAQQGRYNSIATLVACLFFLCCLMLY
ncbi:MAG: hypothetical protein HKN31_04350, partial [Pricia sp.]|nr:hypothetical protein [Pricia sp.]